MHIGIFGGTFDPVHLGHLILADQCREQGGLDHVLFIPAARPPHKAEQPLTPFAQRVEMLQLAIAGNPAFRIDELEKDRPGKNFTVDTLEELQRWQGEAHWTLLIGSDVLPDLVHWKEPARIVALADFVVMVRPGWPVEAPEQLARSLQLPAGVRVSHVVHTPLVDIASRDLRLRAAEGRSLRYLVPRAVECYIQTHGLYRAPEEPEPVEPRPSGSDSSPAS